MTRYWIELIVLASFIVAFITLIISEIFDRKKIDGGCGIAI